MLMLLRDQNSQPQAQTTDRQTWHCQHVFLVAYRKHHQHAVSRHLNSRSSNMDGTTRHATHRNSQCGNSKHSCRNFSLTDGCRGQLRRLHDHANILNKTTIIHVSRDHQTWHCIHDFLNADRKTQQARGVSHHRSRASNINGTTGHATHLIFKCNNSKDSCMNLPFV